MWSCYWSDDFGYFDFWKEAKIITDKKLIAQVEKYKDILSDCSYGFTTDKICIVLTKPEVVVDSEWRLHNENGLAIKWKDGTGEYFLRGVRFEKDLWAKLTQGNITENEIFAIQNQEQKSIAIRMFGYENLVKDAKVVGEKSVSIKGTPYTYQVIEKDLGDDDVPARFVKVKCWSTDKEYLLRVDPRNDEYKDPMGALAWMAGVKKEDYRFIKET